MAAESVGVDSVLFRMKLGNEEEESQAAGELRSVSGGYESEDNDGPARTALERMARDEAEAEEAGVLQTEEAAVLEDEEWNLANAERRLKEAAKEDEPSALVQGAKLGTAAILRYSWRGLASIFTFVFALFYINVHFLGWIINNNGPFCRFGEEWFLRFRNTSGKSKLGGASLAIGILEILIMLILDILVICAVLAVIALIYYIIALVYSYVEVVSEGVIRMSETPGLFP